MQAVFPCAQLCVKYNQHAVLFADSPPPRICCNGAQERAIGQPVVAAVPLSPLTPLWMWPLPYMEYFKVYYWQFVERNKKRNVVTRKLCFQVLNYALNTTNMRFICRLTTTANMLQWSTRKSYRPASSGSSTSAGSSRMQPTLVESFKSHTPLLHTLLRNCQSLIID